MKKKDKGTNTWKWQLFGALLPLFILQQIYFGNYEQILEEEGHNPSKGAYKSLMQLLDTIGGEKAVYTLLVVTTCYFLIMAYHYYRKEQNEKKR
jgi:hypothetical protein